jgi:DeoR/GlpR family transcriptional regulator of sugar metabolism
MKTFERRNEIIRRLQESGRLSTHTLSRQLHVSEVTIRNDLQVLAAQGWVQRLHGGAELAPRMQFEQSFATRLGEHAAEKQRLAQAAAALVQPGDTILLDSSTTVFQLALNLREMPDLRVVTNNIHAAATLAMNPAIEVILLGGVVRDKTASVVGPYAVEMLAGLHAHKAFLSASGLTLERGLTDADLREVEVKRAMVKAAAQVIILLDASKFGQQAFLTFATLDAVHCLIVEGDAPEAFASSLAGYNIEIIAA